MSDQFTPTMETAVAAPSGCSTSIARLACALAKAQGQMKNADKDRVNAGFKSKYADLASVLDACRDALSVNGLAVFHRTEMTEESDQVVVVSILAHESGEWVESRLPFTLGTWHSTGSALTYARRYHLSALAGVAPGDEDDDGNAASERGQQVMRQGGNGNRGRYQDNRQDGRDNRPNGGYASRGNNPASAAVPQQADSAGDDNQEKQRRRDLFGRIAATFEKYHPGTSAGERRAMLNMAAGLDATHTEVMTTPSLESALGVIIRNAEARRNYATVTPDNATGTPGDDEDMSDPFSGGEGGEGDESGDDGSSDPFGEQPDATPSHPARRTAARGEVR